MKFLRNVKFEGKTARRIVQAGLLLCQLFCAMLLCPQAGFLALAVGVLGVGYTISDVRRMGWPSFDALDAAFIVLYGTLGILAL